MYCGFLLSSSSSSFLSFKDEFSWKWTSIKVIPLYYFYLLTSNLLIYLRSLISLNRERISRLNSKLYILYTFLISAFLGLGEYFIRTKFKIASPSASKGYYCKIIDFSLPPLGSKFVITLSDCAKNLPTKFDIFLAP